MLVKNGANHLNEANWEVVIAPVIDLLQASIARGSSLGHYRLLPKYHRIQQVDKALCANLVYLFDTKRYRWQTPGEQVV